MKHIRINDRVSITDITLGAGRCGDPASEALCFGLLDRYLDRGGNCLDTARLYADGACDAMLGRWLASRGARGRVKLCAKGCYPHPATMAPRLSPAEIANDLEQSLTALGTDYADIYLLHRDDVLRPVDDIVEALHALVKAGKALAVGVSNWTAARIARANTYAATHGLTPLSVSQLHHSLALTTPAATGDITHVTMNDVEYGWYAESRMPVMAFAPQAKGYFAQYTAGGPVKPYPALYYCDFPENARRAERLMTLARERGLSVSALALAFARDCGLLTSALCAFTSYEQFEESMAADSIALSASEIQYLEHGEHNHAI